MDTVHSVSIAGPLGSADEPIVSMVAAALHPQIPAEVDDRPVLFDYHRAHNRGPAYARKKVACNAEGHMYCFNHRNISYCTRHGQIDVVAYMGAWRRQSPLHTYRPHMRCKPTPDQVDLYMSEQGLR